MTDTNSYLIKLAKQLTCTKGERVKINTSYNYLEGKIFEHFRDKIDTVSMFGSYDRGTALPQNIDPRSDVDVMIIFKTNHYQPDTFLKYLQDFAYKIYSRSEVSASHPSINIILNHTKFELIPAYTSNSFWNGDELNIPAPRRKELKWIPTESNMIKEKLLAKEKEENGMILPLIRLIKYFNTINDKPFDSFWIENFAIERSYPCKNLRDYFFELINDLDASGKTEEQKMFVVELKSRRDNLILLENRNMNDYIELELQKFIPLIY